MQSAAPPLPDITEDELLSWVKRDTWTAGEAVLLLHGKVPCNPWLSDDELATRFVKSTVHLAVELHRGAIGERGLVNGQQQWIDTPSRWYEWVFGEIPVPHMVGSAFLEPRYAATPRLHYIHAKDVLLEKSQCSPEEIAMWLFANELIAWHGDEPESRRFVFQWSPGDDYDFVIRLTDIYFSAAQLEEFEPVERWMTYQQILDRWAASMTTTEAAELVLSRAGTSDLSAVHPLVGLPRADNEPTVEHCMFPLSRIEEVEASIGIESDRTASGLISAEKKCRAWLEGLMRDGRKKKARSKYWTGCRERFPGLSERSFGRAWKQAIVNTGKVEWSKAGRISKQRIDTPKLS